MLRYLLILFWFAYSPISLHAQNTDVIPENELLKLTPEMEIFVNKALKGIHSETDRFAMLKQAIMSPQSLGFSYDKNANLTAAEAFQQGRGNCVSFSFMMASLLRKAGFTVYFHSPPTDPLWQNYQDQWIQETHMNLLVQINDIFYETDIFPLNKHKQKSVVPLTDTQAYARFYCNQGVFLLTQNKPESAEKHLLYSLKLDESYSNIWQNLGIYYRKTKDYTKALQCLEKASDINPNNEAIYYLLSKTSRRLGDYKDAEKYRTVMQIINPESSLYLYACAEDALAEEVPLKAEEYLTKAIIKSPNCHLFYRALARAYGMQKNYQKMLDSLQQARDVSTTRKLQKIYTQIMETAVKSIYTQYKNAPSDMD